MKALLYTMLCLGTWNCTNAMSSEDVNGVWQSLGSGWILEIVDSSVYILYDINAISCLQNKSADFNTISNYLRMSNDTLILKRGNLDYAFIRIKELPELCATPIAENLSKDLIFNFDVFAKTVEEHYAYFDLNQIHWPSLYASQRAKLKENSSQIDLYNLLDETLTLLNDNHAFLEADEALYTMMESEEVDEPEDALPELGDFQVANMVCENHFITEMTENSSLIKWGLIANNMGFVQIKAMWLYADLNIPQTLIDELGYVDAYVKVFNAMEIGDYIEKEKAAVKEIMDRVMRDLMNTDTIIIDLRFNGGGQDDVSQEILRRFNPSKRKVYTQKLIHGKGYSPELEIFLPADENAFTKPVYLLISPQTGSAAEAFSMACLELEHVTIIGSSTMGATSTALEKRLPNGWYYSISNEINVDNDGINYENIGVPADIELNYQRDRQTFFRSVAADLNGDKSTILNAIRAKQF